MTKYAEVWLKVSIANQQLELWRGRRCEKTWLISTSQFGLGFLEGSQKTPLGQFAIAEKIGENEPRYTRFVARVKMGQWDGKTWLKEDWILSRILWLKGLEKNNLNTQARYIYIHGTNQEKWIGQARSHGCLRMINQDIIELYDLVNIGTEVWIQP
jgi:lipoprotein-anchoring transpeptidase ErfK/SrfK